VAKVPSDAREALTSSLMGIFEKRRMKAFIEWVGTFNEDDAVSHKGMKSGELIILGTKLDRSEHE
jgi:Rab GDP dissociation inhibitor